MSQITTTNEGGLKALLSKDNIKKQFMLALPRHLSVDRFCRVAITALTRNPKLQDCTPESFMRCLLDLSAFGLEPDGRRAHLIPYKDQCTLVIDWKGLAELALRSGVIAKLHMDIVCEHDVFEYDRGEVSKHKVNFREPRGEMYAAYAIAQTKTGEVFADVMGKHEIDAVMKRSQGYKSAVQYKKSHPWMTDYSEMAKKTVFRRLSKRLPLSAEFRDALERDDEESGIVERDVSPSRHVARAQPLDPFQALPIPSDGGEMTQDPVEEATASDALSEFYTNLNEAQTGKALAEAADWADKHLTGATKSTALEAVNNRGNEIGLVWDGGKGAFVEP